jgi:hypothetical protein
MKRCRGPRKGALTVILTVIIFFGVYTLQALFSSAAFPLSRGLDANAASLSAVRTNDLDVSSADGWILTGEKSNNAFHNLLAIINPQMYEKELQGVMGAGVDNAWNVTTGSPQAVIAALGSGIQWQSGEDMAELSRRFRLNMGELTPPLGSDIYDKNGDGVFNVDDYAGDPRVTDLNGNGILDPEDLIWAFSDGRDGDNNGYIDDICGWDFLEDDNDPWDEVDDGAGTRQCRLIAAEANNGSGTPGACPNGMILPVRIGYSSLVDMNDFAQGALFAVDSGAWVIEDGLESFNNTALGRDAIDYAWSKGVAVVVAAGKEGTAEQTFPADCDRVLQVNAIAKYSDAGGTSVEQSPASYLYAGGAANYGVHTMISCPSDGNASAAAATAAGIAGLLYSAAEDKIAKGEIWRYPGLKTPLSACELKQLMTMTADDIDFSGVDVGSDFGALDALIGPSQRRPSTTGWDPYFGYGRVNAGNAVQAIAEGHIPPEVEIRSPQWFEIVNPGSVNLDIVGRVAAVRADSFQYVVEYAAGSNPGPDQWIGVYEADARFEPAEGVLASLDLAKVYRTITENRQAGSDYADACAFTVRVRVRDDLGNWGEDRRVYYCFDDSDSTPGSPFKAASGIAAAPRLADINGDGINEVIVATSDGLVHAYEPDLSELPGWPVHTTAIPLHDSAAAFSNGDTAQDYYASINGAPVIGDLNHDGSLEVVVGDAEGRMYAWDKTGGIMSGFPVRSNPLYSIPDRSDWWTDGALPPQWTAARAVPDRFHKLNRWNLLDKAFLSGPVLCNLDNSRDGSLEIIASAMDDHIYAWHADGQTVAGWPVKLADPDKVSEFDPVTHMCKLREPDKMRPRIIVAASPSVGDINGDGLPEVVCSSNEFYQEAMNVSSDSSGLATYIERVDALTGGLLAGGNQRAYAVSSQGTLHGVQPGASNAPGLPANAYLDGWPASLAAIDMGLSRAGGPAAIGDIDGDGTLEIGIAALAGPSYILDGDGRSHLGYGGDGLPLCLQAQRSGQSADSPDAAIVSAGQGGCFMKTGEKTLYVEPTMSIGALIDRLLPAVQSGSHGELSVWDTGDASLLADFPVETGSAVASPSIADINGDGGEEMVVSSSAGLKTVDAGGNEKPAEFKFAGGATMTSPVIGDCDGDGKREIVAASSNGWLFIWQTSSSESDAAQWPEPGRDPLGTACTEADGVAPARVLDLSAELTADSAGLKLTWTAPGDDGWQGQAMVYDIRYLDEPIDDSNWNQAISLNGKPLPSPAETWEQFIPEDLLTSLQTEGKTYYFALQTRDEAGNISPISNVVSISF